MNIRNNARLTPIGRERLVREVASGQTPQAIARRRRLPAHRLVTKPRPGRARGSFVTAQASVSAGRPAIVDRVIALRRQRLSGKHIAKITVSAATVAGF